MKKTLPALVVVALIAAAWFFFQKKPDSLDLAPGRAAELAPADSARGWGKRRCYTR